jgi:hypothetical protein
MLRLLLERVQDIDAVDEAHEIHRAERIAAVIGDNLEDARAQPLHWLGGEVFLTALRQEQRVADFILHSGRKRLQSPERVAKPHHRLERWRL